MHLWFKKKKEKEIKIGFCHKLVAAGIQNVKLVNFASNAVHFTVEVLDGRRVGIAKFVIQKPGEKTSPIEYQVDVDFEPQAICQQGGPLAG